MASNPFEHLVPQQRQQPITVGTPNPNYRLPPPQTPTNAARDDVALARERQGIERDRLQMERDRAELQRQRRDLSDPASGSGVEQRRAAGFYSRARDANRQFNSLGVGPRGIVGQLARNIAPESIGNALTDPQRQASEAYQRDFVAAALRYESGAAIPVAELDEATRRYFPQPGDSPEAIAAKAHLRDQTIQSLRLGAGQAINAVPGENAARQPGQPAPQNTSQPDDEENFPQRVLSLPQGSQERFRMLERYYQYRQQNPQQAYVGGDDESGPAINAMGVTQEQDQQLLREYQDALPIEQARQAREQFATEHPVIAGVDTAVRAGANALTLGLADRIAAGLGDTTVEQEHAITNSDWENRPLLAFGGTLAGGSRLPLGSTIPRQIGLGAAYGGTYNFNAADGSAGERVDDALIGAGVGGTLAGLLGLGFRAMGRGGSPDPSNVELVQAAQRQGVDLLPADAGGPLLRRATAGTGQTVFGSGPVIRGAQRTEQQMGQRLSSIARREGDPVRQEVLGDRVRSSMEGYNARSGEYGRNLYANARDLAEGTRLQGTRANDALNRQLEELAPTASTDAPLIAGLQRLQADIAPNGELANLTVDNMRRLRTSVRAEAQSEGLRATDYQRRADDVLSALSEDIAAQLPPTAAREFREADRAWAERLNFIDDVENNLLGPRNDRSAEAVARRLLNMTRGDSARFGRILDTVPAEEGRMIRGSAIEELGRSNDGGFSLATFLNNYDKLSDRSRDLLFRGGSRSDVEDLATIARARGDSSGYINRSNTGGAINLNSAIHNASAYAAWGTAGLSAIAENLTGRMLASRTLLRILANPPRDPNRAMRALRRVAVAEPAISGNVNRLVEALQRAVSQTGQNLEPAIPRAAADQRQDQRR